MLNKEELAGIGFGIAENAKIYADNVILTAQRGHGFAAEKANHLKDILAGKDAKIVGGNNAKNGADRLVNGIHIQTKYCNSGSKCIQECFQDGQFRYWTPDGSPMQIEVPSDSYDAAVQAMKDRINKGQVKGISDPQQAQNIVRKGGFTYTQARNIAKFGTVDSISYDAVNGIKLAGTAMGLSAAISFAHSIWSGESPEVAIKEACLSAIKVGGITWVSSILMAQIGRTGVENSLRPLTKYAVENMGTKTAAWIANGLRGGSSSIYGAAATSNVSKLLRGNIVTGVVTTVVVSSLDIPRLVKGEISGVQMLKNVTTNAAGVAGGSAGYSIGAVIGTTIFPGPGTLIGGLVGGLLAGSAASTVSQTALDQLIEDDAKEILISIEAELGILAFDYLLSEPELKSVVAESEMINWSIQLAEYSSRSDRSITVKNILETLVIVIAKQRQKITLPTEIQLLDGYEKMLE
ncbi:MAG: hypothetical protein LH631_08930 [Alkalinema sp. CAN_BIN05]|nr:hypothetical protein [Alkalinema sp. CAN_BIN05]